MDIRIASVALVLLLAPLGSDAVPHHHEHDRSEVQPASVFHSLIGTDGHVVSHAPRAASHRGVHKWRAINSVAHHINEAYGNGDEEVSADEFGRWYRENRPKYIKDLIKIAKQDHIDINKNGVIEKEEMHDFQDLWGVNHHELFPIFLRYDYDQDGELDEFEYSEFLNDRHDPKTFKQDMQRAMIRHAFETIDPHKDDKQFFENEIEHTINEVIRKEGWCEGESANDPKHKKVCADDAAEQLMKGFGLEEKRKENPGVSYYPQQDEYYRVTLADEGKNIMKDFPTMRREFDMESEDAFFWQRFLDHGWMSFLMHEIDHDNNGAWHLNNEMLAQYKSGSGLGTWGFDDNIRLYMEANYIEHMFINYYADNKHRHWEEPENPKWNTFSKKYYGLPQYEDDYTGHPDNVHLHEPFNSRTPKISEEYFMQKYRNKLKKGIVLRTDDEESRAKYLDTLKEMRDSPEDFEWGDIGSYPDNPAYYHDVGIQEQVRKNLEDQDKPDDYVPENLVDNTKKGKENPMQGPRSGKPPPEEQELVDAPELDAGGGDM